MTRLAQRVLATIRRLDMIPPSGRVLAGLSGGADSVALVSLLCELESHGELVLAGVGHLNHQLRPTAGRDERFCRELAAELDLPILVEAADVRTLARTERRSLEDAARTARYGFLEEAARQMGAARIAVGHTRDDQAETYLLRMLRGAGPRGLASIYPRAGVVVRPLLDVSRHDLRVYLHSTGRRFEEDETNRDVSIPRNRIRHELIPYLQKHFSPGVVNVLARQAHVAREDADLLDRIATGARAGIVQGTENGLELHVGRLLSQPLALACRILREALVEASQGRFVGFGHVEALLNLATGASRSGAVDLPGVRAWRRGHHLVLEPAGRACRASGGVGLNSFRHLLSVPGRAVIPEIGWTVTAEPRPWPLGLIGSDPAGRGLTATVDAAGLGSELAVRSRRAGDRLRPLGLQGHKKLQDLFVDRKVPVGDRDRVPLVVNADDALIWVVGHAVSDDFRITDRTRAVILLNAEILGELS